MFVWIKYFRLHYTAMTLIKNFFNKNNKQHRKIVLNLSLLNIQTLDIIKSIT